MLGIFLDLIKVLLSLVIGAFLGIERRRAGKPAGLRTLSLVSSSCTLAGVAGMTAFPNDVSRIIQGMLTGIGFLGAGLIISHRGTVFGLTTAATIWTTAIIGIAIGLGEFTLALAAFAITYLVLEMVHMEDVIVSVGQKKSK